MKPQMQQPYIEKCYLSMTLMAFVRSLSATSFFVKGFSLGMLSYQSLRCTSPLPARDGKDLPACPTSGLALTSLILPSLLLIAGTLLGVGQSGPVLQSSAHFVSSHGGCHSPSFVGLSFRFSCCLNRGCGFGFSSWIGFCSSGHFLLCPGFCFGDGSYGSNPCCGC
jgi:hypothetical protein